MDINTRNLIDSLSARVNELESQLAEKEEQLLTREDEKALFIGLNKELKAQLAESQAETKRATKALRWIILEDETVILECPVCGSGNEGEDDNNDVQEEHNQVDGQDCPVKEVL